MKTTKGRVRLWGRTTRRPWRAHSKEGEEHSSLAGEGIDGVQHRLLRSFDGTAQLWSDSGS